MIMTKKESAPLIETRNLYKSYFNEEVETPVLFDINVRIDAGEFVAIMGPSGSGKSTLMHILGFLDVPTKGHFHFKGEATEEKSEDELARIRSSSVSFVFQSFNLLPRTSVIDNVTLPLLYHSGTKPTERREKALKAIKAVGLTDRATYLSNQLSGGQQQRVAIARALVTEPEVIFADEPTGNLDSASGKHVMEILQNLHDEGHTIILVTHEKTTAEHAARIIRIMDGRIVADDHAFERRIAKNLKELK
ncbi:MAG: ABC-type antimicrobial peptide transport system ATPase component [Candidatus Peribacter riflensis]|uniref:Putative ABC transport system ATP-binding protein n=1 Tax=Candidatus Peribacter riflensis TaxID=1735162 RepID=A0A0S1SNS5_9BACT|nr:MAG: ABC-type antimicrobial peptide transport system ATPase component [Candidatus Peribacter riflensis]ALM11443.1 MAG: ABC-type antimicrobial peptide transport system ATPase component [Candidatus Peribacter riflensis]ALM12545.1 MAG: putative ABC transport system ATP-binding protein [Candidatus Peribacter riflensis]ALM13646.1 MAG: putative ABC transport system ATP-binding protein [Candidatus Peribacter riflensis]ALM14749.1 MAG: putative ABC transport system ATP-binding protein [Candidatus Per